MTAQALSGHAWAGFELAQFTLVLENTYRRTRIHAFAALSAMNGLAQLTGTLLGAALLVPLDFRGVFAASLAARLAIAAFGTRLLPRHPSVPQLGHRELFLRVLGFRPGGGLVHRPVARSPPPTPSTLTTRRAARPPGPRPDRRPRATAARPPRSGAGARPLRHHPAGGGPRTGRVPRASRIPCRPGLLECVRSPGPIHRHPDGAVGTSLSPRSLS